MKSFSAKSDLQTYLNPLRKKKKKIGFVPTMGALHKGHLSLVKRALYKTDVCVVSIYVNPTQFNDFKDLESYPRTVDSDVLKLRQISDNIVVYVPTNEDIYGKDFSLSDFDFMGLDKIMEGANRPGHFKGVANVVERLINAVQPKFTFFGEKDYQQLSIIQHLNQKHRWRTTIVPCPTEREYNGLALSSRNQKLSETSREKSGVIYEILKQVKLKFSTNSMENLKLYVKKKISMHKDFIELEYFEIADELTLTPAKKNQKKLKYRAFIAAKVEGVRLIDNIQLN
ncbi:MAG: pantoate--beta-alanine ligase [Flavobacteriaceae bacterium]|nr:pantoate--beta-alanine ligase [Flavobacteriaceae bacterium]